MNIIKFACGGTYEINGEPMRKKNGSLERYIVYAPGTTGPNKERNCLFGCPSRVKESGRKQFRAWVGKSQAELNNCKGEPSYCVSCQPVGCEPKT